MIGKEPEQPMVLGVPLISPKTSRGQVQEYSSNRWKSDGRRRIAADVVKNGKDLLVESNIDWELVLGSIRREQLGSASYGEAAIAIYDAHLIGALAARGGWATHDPPIVYISGKCLAERVSDKLESFKSTMLRAAVDYGQKALLPHANLYMQTLDFLLGVENRVRYRNTINKLEVLLGSGDIEDAYKLMHSLDDLVRRRGKDSSSSTTSSIRTPPSPGK